MRERNLKNRKLFLRAWAMAAALAIASALMTPAAYAAAGDREKLLVPMGCAVGIQINTDGVLVVGLVDSEDGSPSPAARSGLLPGDLITGFNGCEIHCAEDFRSAISQLTEGPVLITAVRKDESLQFSLEPRFGEKGVELGLWLRDGVTGIGTLTYYDPDTGRYGGLGHSINDMDSGVLIPMGRGHIMRSMVTDVIRGSCGAPGELCGTFDESGVCGSIRRNTVCGIFGELIDGIPSADMAMPIASEEEICLGPAAVIANTSDVDREEFGIEIVRVYRGEDSNRSMMIKITDPELIKRTGGIVQGMSGSPIIQNGKLIGAVTHVMINDPTGGFAVSIEDMLKMDRE